jgi:hypothetical protein
MRQIVRFYASFFSTLIVSAIMWEIGVHDELTRILVSTLTVLMSYIVGDIAAHVHKMEISKYDVAADLIGIGVAFAILLII